MSEKTQWGASFLGTGESPPSPEKHPKRPRCRCGWFGEREFEGVWFCFRHYELATGRRWDEP
jgi:hypothetical protein